MHGEGQPLQRLAHAGIADAQHLRNARLDQRLTIRPQHLAAALPARQQQLDRLFVQIRAIFGQLAPTAVQGCHQRQQQGPRGQVGQEGALLQCGRQALAAALRGLPVPVQAGRDRLIPAVNEALHLSLIERRQGQRAETGQAPLRVGIGIGPRSHQDTRDLGQGRQEVLDRLQQHLASALRLRHLVQSVEQDNARLFEQALLPRAERAVAGRLAQALAQVVPNRVPDHRRRALPRADQNLACGHLPQQQAHRQRAGQRLRQDGAVGCQQVSQVVDEGGLARAGVAGQYREATVRQREGCQQRRTVTAFAAGQVQGQVALTARALRRDRHHVQIHIHIGQGHRRLAAGAHKLGVNDAQGQAAALGRQTAQVRGQQHFHRHLVGWRVGVEIADVNPPLVAANKIAATGVHIPAHERAARGLDQHLQLRVQLLAFLLGDLVAQDAAQGLELEQLVLEVGHAAAQGLHEGRVIGHRIPPRLPKSDAEYRQDIQD